MTKIIVSFVNSLYLRLVTRNVSISKSTLFFARGKVGSGNRLIFFNTNINKSYFSISGLNNEISIKGEHLTKCTINIHGENNKLIIDNGAGISDGIITLRGNNCLVHIGEKTTIGGIRIINVGSNNSVLIGNNCMFSDHVELWASDTHSIYNSEGEQINKEQPIIIEDNVWIGSHVCILKGVTIGKGAIVGMASVVTKSITTATINVGNPSRIVKNDIKWTQEY